MLHVSAYIHNNPSIDHTDRDAGEYRYSSYQEYMSGLAEEDITRISQPQNILEQFASIGKYKEFVSERLAVTQRFKEEITM